MFVIPFMLLSHTAITCKVIKNEPKYLKRKTMKVSSQYHAESQFCGPSDQIVRHTSSVVHRTSMVRQWYPIGFKRTLVRRTTRSQVSTTMESVTF